VSKHLSLFHRSGRANCWVKVENLAAPGTKRKLKLKSRRHFERAFSVTRQQQAKSWKMRAAMSMARLYRQQGKRDAARDLLASVYGWFTKASTRSI
jgi:hypothetical protein